jgi:hypothetical protein
MRSRSCSLQWRAIESKSSSNDGVFLIGTVVDRNGLIATVLTAIEKTELSVTLSDGRSLPGRAVVTDDRSGLQLLKVDASDLVAAEVSDSQVVLGDTVLTVIRTEVNDGRAAGGLIAAPAQYIDIVSRELVAVILNVTRISPGSPLADNEGRLSPDVGPRIDRCERLVALGTEEAEVAIAALVWPGQLFEDRLQSPRVKFGFLGFAGLDWIQVD